MFIKQGTPQSIKISSGLCEDCGKNVATNLVNGHMLCESCKDKLSKEV